MEELTPHLLSAAHTLVARNDTASSSHSPLTSANRPASYKIIGLSLAIGSGLFIGTSFVLKKVGLLKANAKYNEEAGEGYGYLKNAYWWCGMTLMILGEICNFVAYAFTDAILVTPLGALSVVVTTILSTIFLKERLSFVGKVGCFNCIVGSIIIVMNAPEQSGVSDIQEMRDFVKAPGFLTYTGIVIVGSAIVAYWVAPRYGKKSMMVYLSICSFVGGLSVVATQGLGAAVVAQASKGHQFNQWFLYVLLAFVIATLLTEIIYLNKALNIFNAALVTPTYYVFFTSTTIITSAILFQGFHGTGVSIATVVMGFLQICSGVILLQLSKSAKDVPDAAVFKGDLDQVREVGEQEGPESEPKADAIRGTASIVRRMSQARQKMAEAEAKRLRDEKMADHLESVAENEVIEWDGLRRRKTIMGDGTPSSSPSIRRKTIHPPLGMTHFPQEGELEEKEDNRLFERARSRATSLFQRQNLHTQSEPAPTTPPAQPVAMTEIKVDHAKSDTPIIPYGPGSFEEAQERIFGHPVSHKDSGMLSPRSRSPRSKPLPAKPASSPGMQSIEGRRQFSFTNFLRHPKNTGHESEDLSPPTRPHLPSRGSATGEQKKAMKSASEEERLGLVKGDSHRGLLDNSPDTRPVPSTESSPEMTPFPALDKEISYPFQSQVHPPPSNSDSGYRMTIPSKERQISYQPSPRTSPSRMRKPSPPGFKVTPAERSQQQSRQTLRKVTFSTDDQIDPSRSEPNLATSQQPFGADSTDQSSARAVERGRQGTEDSIAFGRGLTMTQTPEQLDSRDREEISNKERFAEQSAKEREERRQRAGKRQSYGTGRSGSQPPPSSTGGSSANFI